MGFELCLTAPSGFSCNVLGLSIVAQVASKNEQQCIFLCDRDLHNSLFTGAYMQMDANVLKFEHNDPWDLEAKLESLSNEKALQMICVVIEGIYR